MGSCLLLLGCAAPPAPEEVQTAPRPGAAELEARIDTLFGRVWRSYEDDDLHGLVDAVDSVRHLVAGRGEVEQRTARELERLLDDLRLLRRLELQVYLDEANERLRALAGAVVRDDRRSFQTDAARLVRLTRRMDARRRRVFHRNADEIRETARRLAIGLELQVARVVVAKPGGPRRSSAVIGTRTYRQGDTVRGPSGAPIEGLVVERIRRGEVAFRWGRVGFVRKVTR